eukprot:1721300-Alexandrium_andersonii.AAC.1
MGRTDNLRARDHAKQAGALLLANSCQHDRGAWQRDLTQDGDVGPKPGPVPGGLAGTPHRGPE